MAEPSSLFAVEGPDVYRPTELARGPWDPNALHGGPVAALLARAVEATEAPQPMQVARLTVELERPVPLTSLVARTSVVRPGKRVQLVEANLFADESRVAQARALRIRTADLPFEGTDGPGGPATGPDQADANQLPRSPDYPTAYHSDAIEMRFVRGGMLDARGPAVVWMRLRYPVVPGEEPSPVQRAAAVADFGNGISAPLDYTQWTFINPDLTVSLHRPPQGEWICLDSRTVVQPHGIGLAESQLSDQRGPFGRAIQLLYVDRR